MELRLKPGTYSLVFYLYYIKIFGGIFNKRQNKSNFLKQKNNWGSVLLTQSREAKIYH